MSDAVETGNRRPGDEAASGAVSAKRWIASAILVVATVLLASCCIFILSAVLTQARLSSIAIDGVSLSIRRLVAVGDKWATTRDQILAALDAVTSDRSEFGRTDEAACTVIRSVIPG